MVTVEDWTSGDSLYFDSHSLDEVLPDNPVRVIVDFDAIEFPKTTIGPEISRVDGNHRLDGPDRYLENVASREVDDDVTFPNVPFMLFLDLTIDEELKLLMTSTASTKGWSHLC